MKIKIFLVLLSLISLISAAENCDKCFKRRVALYDCNVQVARPDDAAAIIAWWKLFRPAEIARSTIHNSNNPGNDCLQWLDGAMINAAELQGDVLKSGQEYANLPPAGPIKSCEYLLESIVTDTDGKYYFMLILETGPSREVAKTVKIPFEATLESAEEAGRQAAAQMMPLVETIQKFEINKRDTDMGVAIGDYIDISKTEINGSLTVKPSKTLLDIGEIIDVEITMTDCDGVPLRNRKIHFTQSEEKWGDDVMVMDGCTGGEVINGEATTNQAGKAIVKFKAGNQKGTAIIHGWYVHTKPYGIPYLFNGYALVQVQVPIPTLWMLTAEFSNSTIESKDTIDRIPAGNLTMIEEYHSSSEVETSGKLTALIENYAEDREHDFEFSTENSEPKLITVSGTGREDDYSQSSRVIDGKLIYAKIWNANFNGFAKPGASIQFYYSNDLKSFSLSIGIKAVGVTHTRMFGYNVGLPEWEDKGENKHEQNLFSGTEGDPGDPASGCRITKTNSGYLIQITRVEKKQLPSYLGTAYSKTTSKLTARLVPYSQKALSGTAIGH